MPPYRDPLPRSPLRLWVPAALLCGLILGVALGRGLERLAQETDLARYEEVRDFVRTHFVREVAGDELLDQALRGMVEDLDRYSRYYTAAEIQELQRETSGRYRGIGAVFAPPTNAGRILFTLPGSPADRAGLGVGDRIVEIDGEAVLEMGPAGLTEVLTRNPVDAFSFLVEDRSGARRVVEVVREQLVDPTVRHQRILDDELGIAYLAIGSFSEETPAEFDRSVRALQAEGAHALIVDLRGNTGGVLSSAIEIANRFVPEGLLVSTEGRGEPVRFEADPDEAHFAGLALLVLIDGVSASASEVLAGALQDYRVAVVVGTRSYGKGMVQRMKHMDRPEGVVKLTTSYYYTPSHRNLERTVDDAWDFGITPDLEVEVSREETRQVHAHLARYSPPTSAIESIRAWEREENLVLFQPLPSDAQRDAALDLARGNRPGPRRRRESSP